MLSGTHFTLEVQGQAPETFAVVDFRLSQSYSTLFSLTVTAASRNPAVSLNDLLESATTLTILRTGMTASTGRVTRRLGPGGRETARQRVSFRYDLLGRRTEKRSVLTPAGSGEKARERVTQFYWEGLRLLGECRDGLPVVYVYEGAQSHTPLARIYGRGEGSRTDYYRCRQNGMPESLTDESGRVHWRLDADTWGERCGSMRMGASGCGVAREEPPSDPAFDILFNHCSPTTCKSGATSTGKSSTPLSLHPLPLQQFPDP